MKPHPEAAPADAALPRFEFGERRFDAGSGRLSLHYRLIEARGRTDFEERFDFGPPARTADPEALDAALDLLHWIAGVSYWKARCGGAVGFARRRPDAWQARALEDIYRGGLAELAWRNRLDRRYWPSFDGDAEATATPAPARGLSDAVLVPMGGGKDSLVALERVRAAGIRPQTVQVGNAALIERVAARAGTRHRRIARRLAPELADLTAAGALNGHVPITAINAAALTVAALLWDAGTVVFANERSADEPTLVAPDGAPVNHQFAKSFEFERLFDRWVRSYVAADLAVFSLLRRDRELAVCREFAALPHYHDVFSSCNRNFHLDGPRTARWCADCPKCRFVFLGLAPFMQPDALRAIFGRDLLDDPGQYDGFASLLALDRPRPFECVGEADEARAALALLAAAPAWRRHAVVAALAPRLTGVPVPSADTLMQPSGSHRIPERFLRCV
jgi:hypothetical protein